MRRACAPFMSVGVFDDKNTTTRRPTRSGWERIHLSTSIRYRLLPANIFTTTASMFTLSRIASALNRSASSRGRSTVNVSFTWPGTTDGFERRLMYSLAATSGGIWKRVRAFAVDGSASCSKPSGAARRGRRRLIAGSMGIARTGLSSSTVLHAPVGWTTPLLHDDPRCTSLPLSPSQDRLCTQSSERGAA